MGAVSAAEAVVRLASLRATRELGARLGSLLRPGDFVGLAGELGAGKTVLVRAICEALEVPEGLVSSPTFAIVNLYEGGRIPVHHADLYRLGSLEELHGTGFFDLPGGASVLLVEWIDRIPGAAPEEWLRIELSHRGPRSREARLAGHGARGRELVEALRRGS